MTWVPPTTCHHYIKWSGAGPTGKSSSDTSQQLPDILVIARIRAHQSNKIHSQSQKTKIQRKRKLEKKISKRQSRLPKPLADSQGMLDSTLGSKHRRGISYNCLQQAATTSAAQKLFKELKSITLAPSVPKPHVIHRIQKLRLRSIGHIANEGFENF